MCSWWFHSESHIHSYSDDSVIRRLCVEAVGEMKNCSRNECDIFENKIQIEMKLRQIKGNAIQPNATTTDGIESRGWLPRHGNQICANTHYCYSVHFSNLNDIHEMEKWRLWEKIIKLSDRRVFSCNFSLSMCQPAKRSNSFLRKMEVKYLRAHFFVVIYSLRSARWIRKHIG